MQKRMNHEGYEKMKRKLTLKTTKLKCRQTYIFFLKYSLAVHKYQKTDDEMKTVGLTINHTGRLSGCFQHIPPQFAFEVYLFPFFYSQRNR
jgi:hypothetical protein